jgi:mono/diheme cytochrome c family protein
MVAQGDTLFNTKSCQRCHGMGGKGGRGGPDLTTGKFVHMSGSYAEIVKVIQVGVPADSIKQKDKYRFAMRAGGGANLTDDELHAVAAYVYSISHR